MKVFINPGHAPNGNPDPGAVNDFYRVRECDIALSIGEMVKNYLIKAGCGVKLLQSNNLTGESAGENIVKSANDWGADVFVSIHCNAYDKSVRGAETLVYDKVGGGYPLGKYIHAQLIDTMQDIDGTFPDRGIKSRPALCVLRRTQMPAVLVETAFIDNDIDVLLLMNYQEEIAAAIARGVTDYWVNING
ncbi:N-acetylmuramoyl-L-alanine amidase [Anaerovibrio sp. RM50]|uniref:N-acetylmuramoyl-L-alanine amidase family protein n=1 Tax=Anaerovibrio sp. RM50 TaxID=1200557 RepID=UPI000488D11A|nr:N-acetylmuramoyl-L-alanine amidase [Anaerovibrio sp. RM50]